MIRKRHLFTVPYGAKVYRVSGPEVRRQHVEFVEGGHGLVYRWIPKGEVWVERMASRQDECFNTIHEITEYHTMAQHGWRYNRAHRVADRIEQRLRRRRVDACKLLRDAVAVMKNGGRG